MAGQPSHICGELTGAPGSQSPMQSEDQIQRGNWTYARNL
jgi:hypothetical protein